MAPFEAHPLNAGFQWSSSTAPYRFLTDKQADLFNENGFFVVEDALDKRTTAGLLEAIDPLEREFEDWLRQIEGQQAFIARADEITFTTHLVTRSALLRRFVAGSPLTDVAADLVGPDVRLYWDQAVYKKPGTDASFPWHQDNGYAFVEPQQYLTCWIALTDATEENGCPWVVPGTHQLGTLRHRLTNTGLVCFDHAPQAVPVPVGAGSIVVFSSLTPHCTGPNRTDAVRKAYIVQYAPEGAHVITRHEDGTINRNPATAPDRQFVVLAKGREVEPG